MQASWRGRPYAVREPLRAALAALFGVPVGSIDAVRIVEHSRFARWHGRGTLATTRRNAIYLRGAGDQFAADPRLIVHEYFHVLRQWNNGELTTVRYLCECARRGYTRNRFEVAARAFAREHEGRLRRLCGAARPAGARGV